MSLNKLKFSAAAAILLAAIVGTVSIGHLSLWNHVQASPLSVSGPAAQVQLTPSASLPDMSGIVARDGASVVNISVSGKHKTNNVVPDFSQLDPDDPFFEFFRQFRIPQTPGEVPVHALGSGFIVTPDGVVLTNAHVVEGADEVNVKLTDKREFKARVLGMDKSSDVAVLKIDASNLPSLKIGNSDNARVGDWVLAIGSPFGFENSATAGIVSAKSRSLPDGGYVPFIQTDVAVNPGNSGGPLFNMAGEVIGINSQIYSRSGGYQGLSFAIPINVAMNVERQIVEHGKVERGRLGVSIQDVSQSLAESFHLKKTAGALVAAVDPASPAAQAGLQPGDIILGVNGREITNSSELPVIIASMVPGEKATLQIWRKGSSRQVDVRVGKFAAEKVAATASTGAAGGRLGVAVRALTPEEQRQAEVTTGVLVEDVAGAAASAGIKAGDIILSVNGERVIGPTQLRDLIGKGGKHVAILVKREDARIFIPVDLG